MTERFVRVIFIVKNPTGARILGTRFTTFIPPVKMPDSAFSSLDPLSALDRQNLHGVAVEKSKVESIQFERLPEEPVLAPGCILESEMFGDRLRVVHYSRGEMTVDVESV